MMYCDHPRMTDTVRRDFCPDCKYEFYYGDAHAASLEDRVSKLVNPGRDRGKRDEDWPPPPEGVWGVDW